MAFIGLKRAPNVPQLAVSTKRLSASEYTYVDNDFIAKNYASLRAQVLAGRVLTTDNEAFANAVTPGDFVDAVIAKANEPVQGGEVPVPVEELPATAGEGQALVFDGTKWVAKDLPVPEKELPKVATPGQALVFGDEGWKPEDLPVPEKELPAAANPGQALVFENGAWKAKDLPVGALDDTAMLVVDKNGFVGFEIDLTGKAINYDPAADVASSISLNERNAKNLAYSAQVANGLNTSAQRPVFNYNLMMTLGQSLGCGYEGWPALSKTQPYDNLMIGDSTRPNNIGGGGFTQIGTEAFKPMVAAVHATDGSSLLTDTQTAALSAGSQNQGESPDIGAVNFARKMFLANYGLASDPTRRFVSMNCAIGGRPIEYLMKAGAFGEFSRFTGAATLAKKLATNAGGTFGISAFFWVQGEANYIEGSGYNNIAFDKATYKANLIQLRNELQSDVVVAIAGQTARPAFITYQTSADQVTDTRDMAISQAQLELSQEQPNWFLACPSYPYPDKGTHLDPNGYRWMGQQMGKVYHKVVTLGQGWKPLSPRGFTRNGTEILIDFHVPCPPLVFDNVFRGLSQSMLTNKGFRVLVNGTAATITSVEIAADTVVRITLASAPAQGATVKIQYGSKADNAGNGNLRDSDPTIADSNYVYTASTGQYAGANIAALVDKPYPLYNWCVLFTLQG